MNKFSSLVCDLSSVWYEWRKSDILSRSDSYDFKTRRLHAENCEKLIKRKYIIIDELNKYFEGTK